MNKFWNVDVNTMLGVLKPFFINYVLECIDDMGNKDGKVDMNDFLEILKKCGLNPENIGILNELYDIVEDCRITKREAVKLINIITHRILGDKND